MPFQQPDLFDGAITPVGPVRPRPAGTEPGGKPQAVEVEPGVWTLVVYDLIPKNGFGHLEFPYYLGEPAESPRWRCDRHAEGAPGGTFLFDSCADVEAVAAAYGATDLRPFMGWKEIPSDDRRRRPTQHERHPL